jgi:hypothetical protein
MRSDEPPCASRGDDVFVATLRHMMFAMFVLWIAAFLGVFLHRRWTIPVALVALAWTAVILRLHMSSDIPLNF